MNIEQTIDRSVEPKIENIEFETKEIVCVDCGNHFSFSPVEQKYFHEQGFINQPKRCGGCRVIRRMIRNGHEPSTLAKANCAQCNKETILPFFPAQGKPIFCTSCFIQSGGAQKKTTKVVDVHV